MGEAALGNRAGKFVLPTNKTVQAAANGMIAKTPKDERISLIFAPGSRILSDHQLRVCDRAREAAERVEWRRS